jgi:hypothetical protein
MSNLNKPLLILNKGKIVISGGQWDGYICVSFTQEIAQEKSQGNILTNQLRKSNIMPNQAQPGGTQPLTTKIDAHNSTCTVIASTIDDPNKIMSKATHNSTSINN